MPDYEKLSKRAAYHLIEGNADIAALEEAGYLPDHNLYCINQYMVMLKAAFENIGIFDEQRRNNLIAIYNKVVGSYNYVMEDEPGPPPVTKKYHIYYGITDILPQEFESMSVDDIMNLNPIKKEWTSTNNYNFTFQQTDIIHYLLVPDNVDLLNSHFGDLLVTTLWNGTSGAYKTNNPGGTYDDYTYKVYFYYNPSGSFKEPIDITAKKK